MEQEEILQTTGEEIPAMDAVTEGESSTSEPESAEVETSADTELTQTDKKPGGVQKRIDDLVRQREDERREAEYWRAKALQQQPIQEQPKQPTVFPDLPEPKSDQFETYDDYVDARADWRAKVNLRQFQADYQSQQRNQTLDKFHEAGKGKYADWDETFNRPDVPVSQMMSEVMLDSPQGTELAYYLGKNPGEARRIASLPMHRQAYELGKIESKLAAPPQRTKTNAPTPTSPVGGKEMPTKKPEDMSYEEYKSWREKGGGR